MKKEDAAPEPMSFAEFAKFIGITEDEIFDIKPYSKVQAFLKKHGYHCTGIGILPLGWVPAEEE